MKNTLDKAKLKTELLAIKTQLEAKQAYDQVEKSIQLLRKKVEGNELDSSLQEWKDGIITQLVQLEQQVKGKSGDVLDKMQGVLHWTDQKIEAQKKELQS